MPAWLFILVMGGGWWDGLASGELWPGHLLGAFFQMALSVPTSPEIGRVFTTQTLEVQDISLTEAWETRKPVQDKHDYSWVGSKKELFWKHTLVQYLSLGVLQVLFSALWKESVKQDWQKQGSIAFLIFGPELPKTSRWFTHDILSSC